MERWPGVCSLLVYVALCSVAAAADESTTLPPDKPEPWSLHGAPCPPVENGTTPPPLADAAGLCRQSPCRNGGECTDMTINITKSYCCDCQSGYYGNNCSYRDPCLGMDNLCKNGGSCIPCRTGDTETPSRCCICTTGFGGPDCSIRSPTCDSKPCKHNGTCHMDTRGHPRCLCAAGYTGELCDDANACASRPCQNRGDCRPVPDDAGIQYQCHCQFGFSGDNCEIAPVPCRPPCVHGQCSLQANGVGQAVCFCNEGFYGPTCSTTNPCTTLPCKNGGNCTTTRGDNYCICPQGFVGKHCDVRLEESVTGNSTGPATGGGMGRSSSPALLIAVLDFAVFAASRMS